MKASELLILTEEVDDKSFALNYALDLLVSNSEEFIDDLANEVWDEFEIKLDYDWERHRFVLEEPSEGAAKMIVDKLKPIRNIKVWHNNKVVLNNFSKEVVDIEGQD